jgi:hypothetical protein
MGYITPTKGLYMRRDRQLPKVKILNRREGKKLLDRQTQRILGITGDEFVRRWERKEFDDPEEPQIMRLAFLIPFGR